MSKNEIEIWIKIGEASPIPVIVKNTCDIKAYVTNLQKVIKENVFILSTTKSN